MTGSSPSELAGKQLFEECEFGSASQVGLFLRQLNAVSGYRALLKERYSLEFGRWNSEQVITRLAAQIARGQVRVFRLWDPASASAPAPGSGSSSGARPVPRQNREQPAPAPEPATFLGNHDGSAQAATLINAAQNGAAVSEVCERSTRGQGS